MMKTHSLPFIAAAVSALVSSPTNAATMAGHGTFSGVVTKVSTKSIDVEDLMSHRMLSFLIVPTDGYGVLSRSGNVTYQMSAIKVGWYVAVDYDRNGSGERHADHVRLLR